MFVRAISEYIGLGWWRGIALAGHWKNRTVRWRLALGNKLSCIKAVLLHGACVQEVSGIMSSFPVAWQLCRDGWDGVGGVVDRFPEKQAFISM